MASGKLNVYNLGQKGVNVVKSPLHLDPGELRKAQNLYLDVAAVNGGVRKRNGFVVLNAAAAGGGGAISGLINLPFPYTKTYTLYAALNNGVSGLWRKSTNGGTTWTTESTAPSKTQNSNQQPNLNVTDDPYYTDNPAMISFRGKLFYAGTDYVMDTSAPTIHCWDGTTDAIVARIPYNPLYSATLPAKGILAFAKHRGQIYVSTWDGGTAPSSGHGRVFLLNDVTGELTQVGDPPAAGGLEFAGLFPYCITSYMGRLWVGTQAGNAGGQAGKVYYIHPFAEATWTVDESWADRTVHSLAAFNGELYAAMEAELGVKLRVYKRATDGTWTTSDELSTSTGLAGGAALTVFGANLFYLAYDNPGSPNNQILIRKFNGSAWSTVCTVVPVNPGRTQHLLGMGIVCNGALYFVIAEADAGGTPDPNSDGIILRSTDGVTFTEVDVATNLRGFIGYTVN